MKDLAQGRESRNNMAHFPIFIDIKHKKCLVIGGGTVALRKVETLLRYEADVQVIAKEVCEEITSLLPESSIRKGSAGEEDIRDAALVIAATSDRQANREAADVCHRLGILVNVIDAPEECSFIFPAVVVKGDISIGINTGGKSPLVSRKIRGNIEKAIPDSYEHIAAQLGELREIVKSRFPEEKDRRRILRGLAAEAFEKDRMLTREEINTITGQDII